MGRIADVIRCKSVRITKRGSFAGGADPQAGLVAHTFEVDPNDDVGGPLRWSCR
jgi:hypothetical protein